MIQLSPLSDNSLVSIIVPSYNQGAFIKETLDSVLQQNYRPIEIIVIDGASTDNTLEVLHQYQNVPELTWISEPDNGPVEAVNKGFMQATGDICAIQSADDFYLPGAIQHAMNMLCSNKDLGLVYGDYVKVDASGKEINKFQLRPFSLLGFLARETHVPQPTAFFRLDLIKKIGGWDERIPYVPDTDLWFRIAFTSRVKKIDAFLACCREHPDQRDSNKERIYRDYKRMLNQSPDLVNAPKKYQTAAKAGLYLLGIKYNMHKSDWELTKALWKAILLHPRCLFFSNLPKHRLVPGYFKLAGIAGNIRRVCQRNSIS